jgi:hypothetical protein
VYAVQAAVNGGSELLIFVPRAAHSKITHYDLGDDIDVRDENQGRTNPMPDPLAGTPSNKADSIVGL